MLLQLLEVTSDRFFEFDLAPLI